MKSIVMPKIVPVDEETKKQLLHEVKETLATNIGIKPRKRFTAADMWNLKRNMRTASYLMSR
jgi:hypothetical protein